MIRRTRREKISWVIVAGVIALSGCAFETTPIEDIGVPVTPEPSPETPGEPPVKETVQSCPSGVQRDIESVILGQNGSFVERDWVTAHSFSSAGFQDSVPVDLFERLISNNYEMLLYFEDAVFGACEVLGEAATASIFVEIRSTFQAPVILEYQLVSEEGGWKIFAVTNPVSGVPNA
jgi:hypothetical protein